MNKSWVIIAVITLALLLAGCLANQPSALPQAEEETADPQYAQPPEEPDYMRQHEEPRQLPEEETPTPPPPPPSEEPPESIEVSYMPLVDEWNPALLIPVELGDVLPQGYNLVGTVLMYELDGFELITQPGRDAFVAAVRGGLRLAENLTPSVYISNVVSGDDGQTLLLSHSDDGWTIEFSLPAGAYDFTISRTGLDALSVLGITPGEFTPRLISLNPMGNGVLFSSQTAEYFMFVSESPQGSVFRSQQNVHPLEDILVYIEQLPHSNFESVPSGLAQEAPDQELVFSYEPYSDIQHPDSFLSLLTFEQAHEIAKELVGGSQIAEGTPGIYQNQQVWRIYIDYGGDIFQVYLAVDGGEVLRFRQNQGAGTSELSGVAIGQSTFAASAPQLAGAIPTEQAQDIAIAQVGGGVVSAVSLGFYHGRLVYQIYVDFGGAVFQVFVASDNGEMVRFRTR